MWVAVLSYLKCLVHPTSSIIHMINGTNFLYICQALTCMNDQRWRSKCLRTRGLLEIEPAFLKNNKVTIAILFSMSMSPATKKLRQLNFKINLEKIWPSLPNRELDLPRWAGYTIKNFTSWATRVHNIYISYPCRKKIWKFVYKAHTYNILQKHLPTEDKF